MRQKTHPKGFRVGITQNHKSKWFVDFNQYPNILKEDDIIRTYLNRLPQIYIKGKLVKSRTIADVKIYRNTSLDEINIIVKSPFPNHVNIGGLTHKIHSLLSTKRIIKFEVETMKYKRLNASFIADIVVKDLEKRVAFRRVIQKVLNETKANQGIKIQISGRLNGAEIARSEWIRNGRVPLQTLRADIDYASKEAKTIYGILGVKIWVFKRELIAKK